MRSAASSAEADTRDTRSATTRDWEASRCTTRSIGAAVNTLRPVAARAGSFATVAAVSVVQIAIIGAGLLVTDRFVKLSKVV